MPKNSWSNNPKFIQETFSTENIVESLDKLKEKLYSEEVDNLIRRKYFISEQEADSLRKYFLQLPNSTEEDVENFIKNSCIVFKDLPHK